MSTVYFPGKVFYVNGMTTSMRDALADARKVQGTSYDPVELVYNDTTPPEKVTEMASKALLGAASLATGLMPVVALSGVAVAVDYTQIQGRKNRKAYELAGKIIRFLANNRFSSATLILHSQGADIGLRALRALGAHGYLRPLAGRINVITIGGMVNISTSFPGRVANFTEIRDFVSSGAKGFFSPTFGSVPILSPSCSGGVCHSASYYTDSRRVRETIAGFTQPRLYRICSA